MIFFRKISFFLFFITSLLCSFNIQHIKNISSLVNSTSVEQVSDNQLLVSTSGGIYSIDLLDHSINDYTENLEYAGINTIALDELFNQVWLGGEDGNIQVVDTDFGLISTIDYLPFNSISEIIFYENYVFAIANYQNQDVIVQYSRGDSPSYLNYFTFNNFLIKAENNGNLWFDTDFDTEKIINVNRIYDIYITINWLYLATNEGVLRVDLTNYENNLLLLLDWDLYDSTCPASSFIDNWFEYDHHDYSLTNPIYFWLTSDQLQCGTGINEWYLYENNLETELINPENLEDIIKSEIINQNGELLYFTLRSDMLLIQEDMPASFPHYNKVFNIPDEIFSNFTDLEIINDNIYLSLENHGVIKTSISNLDYYEYIIPNTIFTNKITAIDLNKKKQLVGLGGDPNIGQGGFLIDDVLNNHNVRNFYSDGDNYIDLNNNEYFETYKNKYPLGNGYETVNSYKGKNLSYISGAKNSEGVKFDSFDNFYFINNSLYLQPDIYHPYSPYNPIKDNVQFLSGLIHVNSTDLEIINGWDSVFTGINYQNNGYNYVTLSGLYAIDDNYWVINPQSEGEQNINKPIVVKADNQWKFIEDNGSSSYYLPEEIAFDEFSNVWISYQKDDDPDYSPGGVKLLRLNGDISQEDYSWWSTPLISVNQSGCSQYNNDLDLENISVWSIDIGADKYGNTILWTLSDYGIMGYVIKYTFSGSFGFLSIEVEPINCNFYFSSDSFDRFSKIRVDRQNNAWVISKGGVRVITSSGAVLIPNESFGASNSNLLSNEIYDIKFDELGNVYFATNMGLSIFKTEFAESQPVSKISVSPNPFVVHNHANITISNLPANSKVQIMNLRGTVLKEFDLINQTIIMNWDGRSDKGMFLGTGVYLVAALDKNNNTIGVTKIAIIR